MFVSRIITNSNNNDLDNDWLDNRLSRRCLSAPQFTVQSPKIIQVFFLNLAVYDCHLFIKKLAVTWGAIKVVSKNKENYISFTKILKVSNGKYVIRFVTLRVKNRVTHICKCIATICLDTRDGKCMPVDLYVLADYGLNTLLRGALYQAMWHMDWWRRCILV